jgi:hypothetical protein
MAKKIVKKLAKKMYGDGNTNAVANTNNNVKTKIVKTQTAVEKNPQYTKTSRTDDKTGKAIYTRKKGTGDMSVVEGSMAASNYKKGGAVKSKTKKK